MLRIALVPKLLWKLKGRRRGEMYTDVADVDSLVRLLEAYDDVSAKYAGSEYVDPSMNG